MVLRHMSLEKITWRNSVGEGASSRAGTTVYSSASADLYIYLPVAAYRILEYFRHTEFNLCIFS